MPGKWVASLLQRFAGREDLGKRGVYQHYWSAMPEQAIMELFDFIELEYKLPAGLLRPEDGLTKLLEPVATRNPFRWLVYQLRSGDRQSELNRQVAKRMRGYSNLGTWTDIATMDDLVRAWCGQQTRKAGGG